VVSACISLRIERWTNDRLFKQLLTTFFVEFIELFLPELSKHLQRDSIEFLDKEVFTDLTGGERHEVDLLARAKLHGTDAFFLVHVENQATRQPEFGQRMFRYFARLHEKYSLPVYPVALLSYDSPRKLEQDHYEVTFPDRRVLSFHYRAIQLNRFNWRKFIRRPNPVAAALMSKMKIAPPDRPRVKLECLRMILTLKLDVARSALLRDFMASYLRLTPAEERVYNEQLDALKPDEKRRIVEIVDEWTLKGMRKTIYTQLEHRFGVVAPRMRQRIERMPAEMLDALTIAVLDFNSMEEAQEWVANIHGLPRTRGPRHENELSSKHRRAVIGKLRQLLVVAHRSNYRHPLYVLAAGAPQKCEEE
jgi:hypothetical protein